MPTLPGQRKLVEGLRQTEHGRLRDAREYLNRVFPGASGSTFSFEDVLGPLEIAEAENYWFHFGGRHQNRVTTNRCVLDALDTWLAMALDPETIPRYSKKLRKDRLALNAYEDFYRPTSSAELPYARLVGVLVEHGLIERAAFVSMNYDVLLDRVILAGDGLEPDYRIEHFYETAGSELEQGKKRVLLLKLHGSLNWRSCEHCHILRKLGPAIVWPRSRCEDCETGEAGPLLIRPSLLKDFRQRVWRQVWKGRLTLHPSRVTSAATPHVSLSTQPSICRPHRRSHAASTAPAQPPRTRGRGGPDPRRHRGRGPRTGTGRGAAHLPEPGPARRRSGSLRGPSPRPRS